MRPHQQQHRWIVKQLCPSVAIICVVQLVPVSVPPAFLCCCCCWHHRPYAVTHFGLLLLLLVSLPICRDCLALLLDWQLSLSDGLSVVVVLFCYQQKGAVAIGSSLPTTHDAFVEHDSESAVGGGTVLRKSRHSARSMRPTVRLLQTAAADIIASHHTQPQQVVDGIVQVPTSNFLRSKTSFDAACSLQNHLLLYSSCFNCIVVQGCPIHELGSINASAVDCWLCGWVELSEFCAALAWMYSVCSTLASALPVLYCFG